MLGKGVAAITRKVDDENMRKRLDTQHVFSWPSSSTERASHLRVRHHRVRRPSELECTCDLDFLN
eukprot:scaffold114516_cov70-Phaeocystis_antarctica.AAC.3